MGSARRIGLLVCDHVQPEFRDVAGDYPEMFDRLFTDHDVDLIRYDLPAGKFPRSLGECDAWMTTGSRHAVYETTGWVRRLADLVRQVHRDGIPFVGVCFGHQMMAHALGGRVGRSEKGWGVGVMEVAIERPAPWMNGTERSYRIINSHSDQITSLPPGVAVLGGNEHCPVSLMTIAEHMLGIQGHPEFTTEYARLLMLARRGRLIPDEVVDAGIASLGSPPDTKQLATWIMEFVGRGR